MMFVRTAWFPDIEFATQDILGSWRFYNIQDDTSRCLFELSSGKMAELKLFRRLGQMLGFSKYIL